jgi:hypothetical protein
VPPGRRGLTVLEQPAGLVPARVKRGILGAMGAASIRWGRIVLGGFLAELILVVFVIPIRALGGPEPAATRAVA